MGLNIISFSVRRAILEQFQISNFELLLNFIIFPPLEIPIVLKFSMVIKVVVPLYHAWRSARELLVPSSYKKNHPPRKSIASKYNNLLDTLNPLLKIEDIAIRYFFKMRNIMLYVLLHFVNS